MRTAAVILAAGASTRFGSPKQHARIGGRTMLEMIAATAHGVGLDPVIAVVPPGLAVPPDVVPVPNDRPAEGISRSLRLGLAAVPPEIQTAVILLGDEPMVPPDAIRAVLAADSDRPPRIVAGRAGNRIGPPVLLPRDRFELADAVRGDEGLGQLLRATPGTVVVDLPGEPIDVDTPADLAAIDRPRMGGRNGGG